jgi:hypothetical protein
MSIVPAAPLGEVTEQLVLEEQLTAVAGLEPNLALVLPTTKPVPAMLTTVPPVSGPTLGLMDVTLGATSYVK